MLFTERIVAAARGSTKRVSLSWNSIGIDGTGSSVVGSGCCRDADTMFGAVHVPDKGPSAVSGFLVRAFYLLTPMTSPSTPVPEPFSCLTQIENAVEGTIMEQ